MFIVKFGYRKTVRYYINSQHLEKSSKISKRTISRDLQELDIPKLGQRGQSYLKENILPPFAFSKSEAKATARNGVVLAEGRAS